MKIETRRTRGLVNGGAMVTDEREMGQAGVREIRRANRTVMHILKRILHFVGWGLRESRWAQEDIGAGLPRRAWRCAGPEMSCRILEMRSTFR